LPLRGSALAFVVELSGRGLKVDYRAVWSFVHNERLGFKKTR
jgi:transposase